MSPPYKKGNGGGKKKKKGEKPTIKRLKNERKERRDFATILYHTCASKWHLVPHIESLMLCHFHMLVGITFSLL